MIFLIFSYITFNLSNGLKVYYLKKENTDVFTFLVLVNSGSFNEEKGYEGMTHFLEHMLFDGNERFTREELRKNFDKLGLYVNAFTREDYTAYFFSGPDNNWREGIYLLYLMLFKSNFPDKEFEKEKGVVIQEMIQDRSREYNVVKEKADSIIFKGTNYSHPVIGYKNTIENLNKKKLIEFYKRFYVPNNMIVLAKGDIDEKELVEFLKKYFGKEKKGEIKIDDINIELEEFLNERTFVEIQNLKNSYIFINFKSVPLNHISSPYFIMLNEILNSDFGIKRFAQNKENVLNVSAGYDARRRFGIFYVNIVLKKILNRDTLNSYANEIIKFLNDLILNLKKEEFLRIKKKILNEKVYEELDPVYSIFYQTDYLLFGNPLLKEKIYEKIENTTFSDFVEFFKGKFESRRIVFLTDKIKKKTEEKVFPEAIHILLKGRLTYEPEGKNGLSQVFFRAILNKDIKKFIDSEGIRVKTYDNPYIPFDDYYHRRDFAYIRVVFPSNKRDKVYDLMSKILNPSFDSTSIKKAKKDAIFVKMLSSNDPRVKAWDEFNKRILKGALSKSLHGEIGEIQKIEKKDLESYAKEIFKKENIIITYESEKRDSIFEKKFLSFGENIKGKRIEFNKETFVDTVKLGVKQSYIIGGRIFKIKDKFDLLKYLCLSMILSDRMQENIREKLGLSYRLYSGVKIYPGNILFYFEIGTNREGIEKAVKALQEEFEKIKRGIDKEEFEIAVNSFKGNMIRRLENPETRSYYKGFYIYTGLGEDFDRFLIENISKVKINDIKEIAQKVLNFEEFSKIYLIGK